jgi:hypothetical protein
MKWILVLIGGLLFGAGLVVSGMTDPARVIGFLDVFGTWDPALAFVMGGAVMSFGAGLYFLKKTGNRVSGVPLPDTSADPLSKRMGIGSAIFGIGWGLGGLCPGPALANLSVWKPEALWFVPLMLLGMFLAQRLLGLDR